jgi:hypothetical protein
MQMTTEQVNLLAIFTHFSTEFKHVFVTIITGTKHKFCLKSTDRKKTKTVLIWAEDTIDSEWKNNKIAGADRLPIASVRE